MPSRADEALLADIHNTLAKSMLARMKSGEPLGAQEWNAIAKFLKDNLITCEVEQSTPLSDLVDEIPMFDKSPLRIIKEA